MVLFFKCDKDPEGKVIRVDAGFRAKSGAYFLLLHRLPPTYPKPPTFVVELSEDPVQLRVGEHTQVYHKAYAIQNFTTKELKFLREAQAGSVSLPLFGAGMANIAKTVGKSFTRLTDAELAGLVQADKVWKLIGRQR